MSWALSLASCAVQLFCGSLTENGWAMTSVIFMTGFLAVAGRRPDIGR
jgi:hypothetical protein